MKYPTVKQLRYFIALVNHNHFGKAAESCFVSQSAFSVAIKELENTLNGRLVDRTNKSVTVTILGREVYQQAKIVIQDLTKLVETSQGNQLPLSGKLAFGIIPTIAPFLLSKLIGPINKQYKELKLNINEDMTLNLYSKLMNGDLDVILIALPYDLKSIKTMPLFKDYFYLTYKKDSKWMTEKGQKTVLADESVLLLEDGHCMREHTLSACNLQNFDKVSHYAASSILTLIELVKNDIGVTYLPEMSLEFPIIKQSDIIIKEKEKTSYREIGLVWRKGSARATEFKLLGQFIQEHCQ